VAPTAYDEWLGRTTPRRGRRTSTVARSARPAPRMVRMLLVLTSVTATTLSFAAPASAATTVAPTAQVIDPAYSEWLTIAAIIAFCVVGLTIAALIIAGLRRANRRAALAALAEEPLTPARTPYRGEVARLFDVDLAAARRRPAAGGAGVVATSPRRVQPAGSARRGRDSAWSGPIW